MAAAPKAPPGFSIEKVSPPETSFPMFACLDDRGRLYVAESSGLDLYLELQKQTRKCRIRMLEDRDNDGRYETSTIFKDKLVFPMGVAWRDGKLYVPDPPDLLVVEDTNDDGVADKSTKILTGFGHQDNGSLHGLTFGPDGMLYMTTGNPDGYKLKRADGSILSGESGALFRCKPDGSDSEVLCRGFENLVEIVFMPGGQMIGTDNWFQRPAGGLRDALVHLLPGAHYPLHQRDKGTQFLVSGEPLPAVSMFPAVALSGLMRYEGYSFPSEFRDNLFSAQHNSRTVGRHIIKATSSTFTSEDSAFITGDDPDFHPSDVLEDADGSLLVIDTGGWYVQHCPTGQIRNSKVPGAIYRVRYDAARTIDDPHGRKIDFDKATPHDLVKLLSDVRPPVAARAQRTLISRGQESIPALIKFVQKDSDDSRPHLLAFAALGQIDSESARAFLTLRLRTANTPSDIQACALALAWQRDKASTAALEHWLENSDSHGRLACAQALAVCGRGKSIPALINALTHPDLSSNRFLHHALLNALYQLATPDDFTSLLSHPHARVQEAALILLDQQIHRALKPQALLPRLSSTDPHLRATAQRLLKGHPEWSDQALAYIDRTWEENRVSPETSQAIVETLVAFSANPKVADWLATALAKTPQAPRKLLLLEAMTRIPPPKDPSNWIEPLRDALAIVELRPQALRVIAPLPTAAFDDELRRIVDDSAQVAGIRLEALRPLLARQPKPDQISFDLLLSQLTAQSPALRLTAAELMARSHLSDDQLQTLLQTIEKDRLISPDTLLPLFSRSVTPKTAEALLAYFKKSIDSGWRPPTPKIRNLFDPISSTHGPQIEELVKTLRAHAENQAARLTELEPLLKDGNPTRGREIFFGNQVACSTCHRIGSDGGLVGPDLTKVGAIRAGRDILESIVFPASTIAQGYDHYIIDLKSGDQLTGIIAERTDATITLRDSASALRIIRMSDVKNMRRDTTSLMPQGLDSALSPEQFRDLLAFLQSLK